ncbi:MAG: hypothetical protein DRQ08_01915 [Candidatus Latescibacterota bacterium]|nr:MAG: hypothetical protein DRQ08_01915 [Candidatus Latescibacterota bacterium]
MMYLRDRKKLARKSWISVPVLLFVAFVASSGCGPKKGRVLATVGDKPITFEDLREAIARMSPRQRPDTTTLEGWRKCLELTIDKELLVLEARSRGLEDDPEVLEMLENEKRKFMLWELYDRAVRAKARERGEEEAFKFYKKRRMDESIRISQILVKTKSEAEEILKALKKGRNFEDLAEEVSLHRRSAERGGDMGWLFRDQIPPEIAEVAFSLDIGQIYGPVKTIFGYHIVKVTGRKEVGFEEVRKGIEMRLMPELERRINKAYIDSLEELYHVECDREALGVLRERLETSVPPKLSPDEEDIVLFRSDLGALTLGDWVENFEKASFLTRPDPKDSASVRDFGERLLLSYVILPYEAKKAGLDTCSAVLSGLKKRKLDLMVERLREMEILDRLNITPEEERAYYETHRDEFVRPPKAEVIDIHLRDKQKADSLLALIREGADMEELAKRYSTLRRPGRLRWRFPVSKDRLSEAIFGKKFVEEVFRAKVGEVVGPVEAKGGYAIFKVVERSGPRRRSFEEARREVTMALRREKEEKLLREFIEKLKKKYKVTVYEDALRKIVSGRGKP